MLPINLFRITQTESKLKKENINSENAANKTHYEIGKKVRKAIADIGETMPEDLPTPDKSLKELEKENRKLDELKKKKQEKMKKNLVENSFQEK